MEIEDLLSDWLANFPEYAQDCLVIRDHNTALLSPLVLNAGQQILHTVAEKQKTEKGFIRILFLKSRRFGGSTYVEGRYYWLTSMLENRSAFICGHEEKSTATLFDMAKLFQERNPIAPAQKKSNAQEIIFDNTEGTGLKSGYKLATARNLSAGRSQGIHYLHLSEEAFFEHGDELLTGLMQCVPDPPAESEVFRESTANGYGNTFQEDVFTAYHEGKYPYYTIDGIQYAWSSPSTDWILVFIPWFLHERYTLPFETEEQREAFIAGTEKKVFDPEESVWIDSEEKRIMQKYRITYEQLHWRAWAIENKCRGNIDNFRQEYPSTVLEAFLSLGSNVYPQSVCDEVEAHCEQPILTGELYRRGGTTAIKHTPHGKFQVWEKPVERQTYFLTVDVAGGKKPGTKDEKKKPDYTCIDVWNHKTGIQAAQWHGHIAYDLVGDLVELVGDYYFRATACVELMNHGFTVVADLNRLNYPMYEHKPDEPGWLTTAKTKPLMVDGLYRAVKVLDLQIRCKETVAEMRTYIELNGTYNAASGCKDDRVITAAMASQMMTMLPRKFNRGDNVQFNNWRGRK